MAECRANGAKRVSRNVDSAYRMIRAAADSQNECHVAELFYEIDRDSICDSSPVGVIRNDVAGQVWEDWESC